MWAGLSRLGPVLLTGIGLTVLGCGATTRNGSGFGDEGGPATGSGGAGTGAVDGTGVGGFDSASSETGATGAGGTGLFPGCTPGIPRTSQVPRLLNREYDAILRDLLGVSSLAAAEGQPPSALLVNDFLGEMNADAWQAYLRVADLVAAEVMASDNRPRFMSCDPAANGSCYEETLRAFGRKMFRRPLTEAEVARFMALTEPDWTPEEISEALLYAFLVSPSFILVPELNTEPEGYGFRLSSHEVATRLSLMLWGSVPDDELNEAADQNLLVTRDQIEAQAQRMIQLRDKASPQISRAHGAYLGTTSTSSHWWKVQHDEADYPGFTERSVVALQGEVEAFFDEIAYAGGSFRDIFLSNVAFVNEDTAAIYGLDPAKYGADLVRVELDASERPGVLTRAGFLSSFSTYNATNPILRGAFLSVSVLGIDPGAPDDHFPHTTPAFDYATRREQVETLTSPAECAACHNTFINPPGYVLENYDAVGAWQTVDPAGGPIDPVAEVVFGDASSRTMGSALELMEAIAEDPTARHVYAEKLVTFFTGRAPNANDACLVDIIAQNLAYTDYGMLDLVVDITRPDSFRVRTADN